MDSVITVFPLIDQCPAKALALAVLSIFVRLASYNSVAREGDEPLPKTSVMWQWRDLLE
jgi:hypothetical protein